MERILPAKAVQSLSLGQVHALSLLAFFAAVFALAAPPLLLPTGADGAATRDDPWPARLCANLAGYASVLLPLYLAVRLTRAWGYARRGPRAGLLPACVRLLALGGEQADAPAPDAKQQQQLQQQHQLTPYSARWCLRLAGCSVGLQAAYLTWGVLQERMMTFDYGGERFRDSQFLVFANRALGGLLAVPLLLLLGQGGSERHGAPAFEYTYSSLSNILSSWCQYEALVYVTFPTQVLAKASKIIPVMLMGRLLSRKSFRWDEYFTSGLISAGTAVFLLSSPAISADSLGGHAVTVAGASGAALLAGYLVSDAFTSSWQSRLFVQHRVTALQMMAGSSLVSCLVTVAAQLQQGSLPAAMAFTGRHPLFLCHLALLSLCSTLGQLVIYHTIDCFGPVTFTIIMTVRQAFAILISCLVYQHRLSCSAWLGVAVVFLALFLRIHFGHRHCSSSSSGGGGGGSLIKSKDSGRG